MAIRITKILLVLMVAFLGGIYAGQNLANLGVAYDTIAYVLAMQDHEIYPSAIGPAMTSPSLVWLALILVICAELGIAGFSLKGAYDLWQSRRAPANTLNSEKTYAVLGAGLGVLLWFGFFIVGGGGYFQMWQTEIGQSSMNEAFKFGTVCAFVFIILCVSEE